MACQDARYEVVAAMKLSRSLAHTYTMQTNVARNASSTPQRETSTYLPTDPAMGVHMASTLANKANLSNLRETQYSPAPTQTPAAVPMTSTTDNKFHQSRKTESIVRPLCVPTSAR